MDTLLGTLQVSHAIDVSNFQTHGTWKSHKINMQYRETSMNKTHLNQRMGYAWKVVFLRVLHCVLQSWTWIIVSSTLICNKITYLRCFCRFMIFDKFIKFVKLLCQNTSNLCIIIGGVTGGCVAKIPNSRYLTVWSEERTDIFSLFVLMKKLKRNTSADRCSLIFNRFKYALTWTCL